MTRPNLARSAEVKTIFFSAALVAALAVGAGTDSPLFAQSNFGGQPQPGYGGGQVGGNMPAGQPNNGMMIPGGQFGGNPAAQPGAAATGQPRAMQPNQPNFGATARPPAGAPQVGVNGIAVVDIASIFKNYQKFKAQMDQMKLKVDAAENDIKKDQEACKQEMEQIKNYNAGSPDYKKLEADILKKQGDLNLKVKLQQKDFMEQEGRVYYGISREIDDAVRLLAARYNIVLVLRFTGDEVDPSDRNDILRGINKSIVYYDKQMDITAMVLGELNRSGPPQQTDPRMSTVPQPIQQRPR
jgi:Skp family chaperone for outer membrane proteins